MLHRALIQRLETTADIPWKLMEEDGCAGNASRVVARIQPGDETTVHLTGSLGVVFHGLGDCLGPSPDVGGVDP